jgi:hypothetical protein
MLRRHRRGYSSHPWWPPRSHRNRLRRDNRPRTTRASADRVREWRCTRPRPKRAAPQARRDASDGVARLTRSMKHIRIDDETPHRTMDLRRSVIPPRGVPRRYRGRHPVRCCDGRPTERKLARDASNVGRASSRISRFPARTVALHGRVRARASANRYGEWTTLRE